MKRGITAIEVMIIVAIIGILCAIAVPRILPVFSHTTYVITDTTNNKEYTVKDYCYLGYGAIRFKAEDKEYVMSQYSIKTVK